jgi:hypothetical protein
MGISATAVDTIKARKMVTHIALVFSVITSTSMIVVLLFESFGRFKNLFNRNRTPI